jgi:hypothetical protein
MVSFTQLLFVMHKKILLLSAIFISAIAYGQGNYKTIKLPKAISGTAEEYSGMCTYNNRVYLLPQYGDHKTQQKKDNLKGDFFIYSLRGDSIDRVVDGKDTALTAYKTLKVINIDKLPDTLANEYEGFEAMNIVGNTVFLSVESDDMYQNCYLLKGRLDTVNNQVIVDPLHILKLKRPELIYNAGYEAVTWLPTEKKLLAYYEYNGRKTGGNGYLIDTSFSAPPEAIKTPQLYFRITDMVATNKDKIYGVNYFYNGDYKYYLDNKEVNNQEANIQKTIPDLRDSLLKDSAYLKHPPATYARIVMLKNRNSKKWKQVANMPGYRNNWEGITLYRKGALIITDANGRKQQDTLLAYVEF